MNSNDFTGDLKKFWKLQKEDKQTQKDLSIFLALTLGLCTAVYFVAPLFITSIY